MYVTIIILLCETRYGPLGYNTGPSLLTLIHTCTCTSQHVYAHAHVNVSVHIHVHVHVHVRAAAYVVHAFLRLFDVYAHVIHRNEM